MNEKYTYVTVTGQSYYLGMRPFGVGRVVRLCKEPDNRYDAEAIRVQVPYLGTVGYVANSTTTVFRGTESAGRIWEKVPAVSYAKVQFITREGVIARLMTSEEDTGPEELWDTVGEEVTVYVGADPSFDGEEPQSMGTYGQVPPACRTCRDGVCETCDARGTLAPE
ncbi:MAG: HIRAN domain-containing protein [Clostridia bacterium]|nr:HIRAN domain-containing protein [Clostridia bacterium]